MRLLQDPAFFQNDQPITAAHKRPCIMIQPLAGGIQEASSTLPAPRYPLYVTTVDVGCIVYLKISSGGHVYRFRQPGEATGSRYHHRRIRTYSMLTLVDMRSAMIDRANVSNE